MFYWFVYLQKNIMVTLAALRKEIDEQDDILLKTLVKRFAIVQRVRDYKQANTIQVLQNDRRKQIQEKNKVFAETYKLDPQMVAEIFEIVHLYSLKEQE